MRGSLAKEQIFSKILETFEGSFMYNNGKECRIPTEENGSPLQIKITLTAAKDLVNPTEKIVIKSAAAPKEEGVLVGFPAPHKKLEPTPEEKQNIEDLLVSLGLQ